jgi:hypothetical protein
MLRTILCLYLYACCFFSLSFHIVVVVLLFIYLFYEKRKDSNIFRVLKTASVFFRYCNVAKIIFADVRVSSLRCDRRLKGGLKHLRI